MNQFNKHSNNNDNNNNKIESKNGTCNLDGDGSFLAGNNSSFALTFDEDF